MKLTKKIEAEILKAYHTMWDANWRGDIKTFASYLEDDIVIFGTALAEVFSSKKEAAKFYEATAHQMTGKAEIRNRRTTLKAIDETVLLSEQCDLYVQDNGTWIFYGHVRITGIFVHKGNSWKLIHMHGSLPDSRAEAGEQIATEKIAAENQQLREAVQRRTVELESKNRELEIEAALEKVRSVAMSMVSREDMLLICKAISDQLFQLGLKGIRNVQTAIFYPERGTFMNYEYYTRHDKTIITEVDYRREKSLQVWAKKMMKGAGNEYHEELKGKQLRDWYAYTQSSNMFVDKYILDTKSLNYYSHSLGPVSLILSTYSPITTEESAIYKRFLNVFELAFQRYLHLERAFLQAREAQTELALERIRAKVTAMMESKDLLDIVVTMRHEFVALGHEAHYFWHMRWLPDKYEKAMTSGDGTKIGMMMTLPRHLHGDIPLLDKWEKGKEPSVVYAMDVDEAIAYVGKMVQLGNFTLVDPNAPTEEDLRHINGLTFVMARTTHGEIGYSLPGKVTQPPAEDIVTLVRFAGVFDLAYRRFEDLQDAEKRNRETLIELALERVRARSLAMHHTSELQEVVNITAQQLHGIGMDINGGVFICINAEIDEGLSIWASGGMADYVQKVVVPVLNKPIFTEIRSAIRKGNSFLIEKFSDEEKWELFNHLFTYEPWKSLSKERKIELLSRKGGFARSVVINYYSSISITDHHGRSFTEEENEILRRFGRVFEQSYTRFLDLQTAEAQARDAQIEAALERVRAKAMAMHSSADLPATAITAFSELKKLGFTPIRTGISIHNKENRKNLLYSATSRDGGENLTMVGWAMLDDHPVLAEIYNKWLVGEDYFPELHGELLKTYYEQVKGSFDVPIEQTDIDQFGYFMHFTYGVFYGWCRQPVAEDEKKLLRRFASVIDLTFKRYFDLQKAEAQSREASIELAVERVRARTMAMQHSGELAEASEVLDQQVRALGIDTWGCAFHIYADDPEGDHEWFSSREGSLPFYKTPRENFFLDFYEKGKAGESFFLKEFVGEDCKKAYDYLMTLPVVGDSLRNIVQSGGSLPDTQYDHIAFFKYGYILFITYEPAPEAQDIFQRFAKVFEQTYTRFLDLQKAEAQTKESQIQLALERVRARTMAMQRSEELPEVAALLFQQVKTLGVPQFHCGFNIFEIDDKECIWYPGSADGEILPPCKIPLTEHPVFIAFNESRKRGEEFYVYEKEGEYQAGHYKYMLSLPVLGEILQNMLDAGIPFPTFQIDHVANFSHGNLIFITSEHFPEMHEVFKRFAKVFEQTYTRFLDLKKAEAQAREAQIEAALERVRSRTMGMQKSTELNEVAFVLFEQARLLGGHLWGTGFALCNVREGFDEFWFANEMGVMPPVTIPNNEDEVHKAMFQGWKQNQEYLFAEKGGAELAAHYKYLYSLPQVKAFFDPMLAAGFSFPEWQQWHAAYFSKGYLLIITTEPYTESHIFKRFAKVFDQTYTRFLDLQKAEAQAREAQIEAALEKVRSRTMAMQSSEELSDAAYVLFEQLNQLGVTHERINIGIINEENQTIDFWITEQGGDKLSTKFSGRISEPTVLFKAYSAWKKGEKSVAIDLQGEALAGWLKFINEEIKIPFNKAYLHNRRVQTAGLFSKGMLVVTSPEPLNTEAIYLLEKFAGVFDLTYTRFSDLKIAEAHALQAEKDLEEIKIARKRAEEALTELKATQEQLVQQEKLASLGQLTAGIAHEIQNPLNFVNNFSEINAELSEEILDAAAKGDMDEVKALATDIKANEEKIREHGKRADAIVKGMLQHSRSTTGTKEPTNISALADEYLRLAYHGMRAKDKIFNADLKTDFETDLPIIPVAAQDIGRVLLNLFNNAFYAVNERKKIEGDGFKPEVRVETHHERTNMSTLVVIRVSDNGPGIPESVKQKIFQPFFTTKPTGEGTGLGLSLSYDIIKAHGGRIECETNPEGGTSFTIQLPDSTDN